MTETPHEGEPTGAERIGPEPPHPAPPPPPPPPVGGETVALESETSVRSGGIGARLVAAVVGGLLLLGGVGFAAAQMGGDDGAPEDAVADMFAAIADEDVLGVLATLDPGERDTLTGPIEDLFTELERLEVVDDSFELTGIEGVDLEFEGLTFRSEPVRDDLVRVYLTGGTASYAFNTDELPIGDFLVDTFDRFGVEYRGIQESDSDTMDPAEADDTFIVVRDTGDGWRISLGYTAAEAARVQSGKPLPAEGAGLAPVGADSPEAAVDGFLRAVADLDVRGAVARLSPAEFAALQDYWPILVDDADLAPLQDLPVDIELTELEMHSETDGDHGQVFIDAFGVDVVAEEFTGGATVADGCIALRGDAEEAIAELEMQSPICQEDIEQLYEEAMEGMGGPIDLGGFGSFEPGDFETPAIGISTTKVDGKWYVAPIRSYADLGIAVLQVIDREDLDAMVDAVEEFFGAFGGMVGGGFMAPGLDGGDFDDLGTITEEFEEFGEPIEPGTGLESFEAGSIDARTSGLVEELVSMVAGDADVAACVLAELKATATPNQMVELADAYAFDFEPSMDAQDVLFTALEICGG